MPLAGDQNREPVLQALKASEKKAADAQDEAAVDLSQKSEKELAAMVCSLENKENCMMCGA